MITVYYFFLLPRHDHFHDLFIVHDQLSAHVHGRAVERAGELEWRLVFVPHRRASVGTAHKSPTQPEGQWCQVFYFGITPSLSPDC